MINSDGGFSLNGISFGGAMNGGVQTSSGAGANFNTLTKKGTKINAKYFLGYAKTLTEQTTDVEQNLGSNFLYTKSISSQNNRNYSHNIGARIEAKLDSLTKLTVEPAVSIGLPRNIGNLNTSTFNTNRDLINDGKNASRLTGRNTDYGLSTSLWKDFKKVGRSLNISVNISQRKNLSDNYNVVLNNFFNPTSTDAFDQWRDNDIDNFNINLNANYSEPISKALSLNIATSSNYLDNENDLATFLRNPSNQAYDIAVPNLTETVMQSGFKTNNRVSLRWKVKRT